MPARRLYHVTYTGRLSRIADEGLLPGQARALGGSPYDSHIAGAIFLTAPEGLMFWYARAEEWAHHSADDLLAEGWIPVVLRVEARRCKEDALGTSDAGHAAFKCKEEIPPGRIELWNGGEWIPIEDYETLDPTLAVDDEEFMLGLEANKLFPRSSEWNPVDEIKRRMLDWNPPTALPVVKRGMVPRLIIGQVGRQAVFLYRGWELDVIENAKTRLWDIQFRRVGAPGAEWSTSTTFDGAVCVGKIVIDVKHARDLMGDDRNFLEIWDQIYRIALVLLLRVPRTPTRPPTRASVARALEENRRFAIRFPAEAGTGVRDAFRWWDSLPLRERLQLIDDRLELAYCMYGTDPGRWS